MAVMTPPTDTRPALLYAPERYPEKRVRTFCNVGLVRASNHLIFILCECTKAHTVDIRFINFVLGNTLPHLFKVVAILPIIAFYFWYVLHLNICLLRVILWTSSTALF